MAPKNGVKYYLHFLNAILCRFLDQFWRISSANFGNKTFKSLKMTNIFHSKCKWPVVKSRENFDTHSIIKTYQIKFYLTWYDGLSWNLDRLAIIWIIFLKKYSVIWWIIQLFFFLELYHFFLWEVCQRIIVGKRICTRNSSIGYS